MDGNVDGIKAAGDSSCTQCGGDHETKDHEVPVKEVGDEQTVELPIETEDKEK